MKLASVLLIGLLAVSGFTVFLYYEYSSRLAELEWTVQKLESEKRALEAENRDLFSRYQQLEQNYLDTDMKLRRAIEENVALKTELAGLQLRYQQLQSLYNNMKSVADTLNASLSTIASTLSTCCLPEAFSRVLSLDKVRAVAGYVSAAGVVKDDVVTSIHRIYSWIRRNVEYAFDQPKPHPALNTCLSIGGDTYCFYSVGFVEEYVQDPEFTAKYKRGDCDDQAVLAYAMIKYYFMFVHGKDYDVWIALLRFSNGEGHAAVFVPVAGGYLLVVDPAGSYITGDDYVLFTVVKPKPVLEELARYSRHFSAHGGITYVELYRVDVRGGDYQLIARGDLTSVSYLIASYTK